MRRIFTSDDELSSARRSFAFWFLIVSALLTALIVGSFIAGMEWQSILHKEAQRIERERGKRAQPATFRPLLNCDRAGREEYARICAARVRMGKVGQ